MLCAQELQTLNANQLIVIRNLTEQLESTKEQIMQECKAQSELEMAQVERELADMATMRTEQQVRAASLRHGCLSSLCSSSWCSRGRGVLMKKPACRVFLHRII